MDNSIISLSINSSRTTHENWINNILSSFGFFYILSTNESHDKVFNQNASS